MRADAAFAKVPVRFIERIAITALTQMNISAALRTSILPWRLLGMAVSRLKTSGSFQD
jgi:hypothetical protein